jgi:hypothetical protein
VASVDARLLRGAAEYESRVITLGDGTRWCVVSRKDGAWKTWAVKELAI